MPTRPIIHLNHIDIVVDYLPPTWASIILFFAKVLSQFWKDATSSTLILAIKATELVLAILHAILFVTLSFHAATKVYSPTYLPMHSSTQRSAVVSMFIRIANMPVVDELLGAYPVVGQSVRYSK